MRTLAVLFLLATTLFGLSNAQNVEIPDTAFLHALIDAGVDINADSLISNAEAEAIITLEVAERGIVDMTGIEAFINLDSLDCKKNAITSLDLSMNEMLTVVNCTQNDLASLNVTNCTILEWLHCWSNELTSLDVSNDTALIALYIQNNQIDTLDLSNNKELTFLRCRGNLLTQLDISNNTALTRVGIDEMPTLTEVCVWELPFPPDGVDIDTSDSPNVCFETDCNGACGTSSIISKSPTEITFYPNPTNDILTIETAQTGQHFVEVRSLNGQLLFNEKVDGHAFQINLSSFRKGLYLITIRSRDYVRTEKIVKL